jgi:hypothetical protein
MLNNPSFVDSDGNLTGFIRQLKLLLQAGYRPRVTE